MDITEDILEEIVDAQEVSALGLVTPQGLPHCTPVWVHHYRGKLYIFSRSDRAKAKYIEQNTNCMIAFDRASLRGTAEIIKKGSEDYTEIYDLPDGRYGHFDTLKGYKQNWDIAFKITPTKLYR